MKALYTVVFLFCLQALSAQLSISASATLSTCSANGKITVAVTGGTGPYTYFLNNAVVYSGMTSNYTILGLSPGIYNVKVSTGINPVLWSNTLSATVGGNYLEPTLSCALVGCDIEATVMNGLAPFNYQISTVSPNGPFGPPQSSNIFVAPPLSGIYYVRVTDSCNNFYTRTFNSNLTQIYTTTLCTPDTGASATAYTVAVDSTKGGFPPYQFSLSVPTGSYTALSPTEFTGLTACDYQVDVTDNCGHTANFNFHTCVLPEVQLVCINCSTGNVTLTASGGMAPYTFYLLNGSNGVLYQNLTGIFSLPPVNQLVNNTLRTCYVKDACGMVSEKLYVHCFKPFLNCGGTVAFDGTVNFSMNNNYFYQSDTPVTVICNSCPMQDTLHITSFPQQMPHTFVGLMSGTQTYTLIDDCGNPLTFTSECKLDYTAKMIWVGGGSGGGGGGPANCSGGGMGGPIPCGNTLSINCPLPNVIYKVYDYFTNAPYDSNSTGLFPFIPPGFYGYQIIAPSGFPIVQDSFDTRLYFPVLEADCANIWAGACPSNNIVFRLYSGTGTLLATNMSGYFPNLTPNTLYKVSISDPQSGLTKYKFILTETLGELDFQIVNCSNVVATLILPNNPLSDTLVYYHLVGQTTGYDSLNHTGLFPNLAFDSYILEVSRGNCGYITQSFSIGQTFNPTYCLMSNPTQPLLYWKIQYMQSSPAPLSLFDSSNILQSSVVNSNTYYATFSHIQPNQQYYFRNGACEYHYFTLPPIPKKPLNVEITSICQNLACIQATGAMTGADWQLWSSSSGFDFCGVADSYVLTGNGPNISSSTGTFCNLNVGGTYTVLLKRGNVTIDQYTIVVPTYIPPNLTAFDGFLCAGVPTADVMLTANGTGLPYTFVILNPPPGYTPTSIISNSDTVFFANLPAGNYDFMIYDYCGASSDYSCNVSDFVLDTEKEIDCFGNIKLTAPYYFGATYLWKDYLDNPIGNSFQLIATTDTFNVDYYLEMSFAGCTFHDTIPLSSPYAAPLSANAGADVQALLYNGQATIQLNGSVPSQTQTLLWEEVSNVSPQPLIAFPNQAHTAATVFSPADHYFALTAVVNSGCVLRDSMKVRLTDCGNDPEVNVALDCFGHLSMSTPLIAGASYSWYDPHAALVGNSPQFTATLDSFNVVYQLEMNFGECGFSQAVPISSPYIAPLKVDAGLDAHALFWDGKGTVSFESVGLPQAQAYEWREIINTLPPSTVTAPHNLKTDVICYSPTTHYFELRAYVDAACVVVDTVMATFTDCGYTPVLDAVIDVEQNPCEGQKKASANLNLTSFKGPYTVIWSNGMQNTNQINNLPSGNYTVTIIDSMGCIPGEVQATFPFEVHHQGEYLNAYFTDNWTQNPMWLHEVYPLTLTNQTQGNMTNWVWDLGIYGISHAPSPTLNFTEEGLYPVTLTVYSESCSTSFKQVYEVIDYGEIYVPNAFTPHNQDTHNDQFGPIGINILEQTFTIYDRWGKMVFTSDQVGAMWDGTFEGKPCPEGVYTYTLEATLKRNGKLKRAGTFTLLR